ncbi:MAG: hypothetical protein WKG07_26510 [Hymenobacter sp.]
MSKYADLTISETRDDFEILDGNEYVETGTLEATIAYGLDNDRRNFALYLDSAVSELKSVMLFFTPDGKLVLGLSTEYDENSNEMAERILATLKSEFDSSLGLISIETHPGDAYDCIVNSI